jgi:thioester reductase-like protein
MISIIDRLEHGATAYPDRRLYSFLDVSGREKDAYTYLAFHERTRHLAQHLQTRTGLRRGDRALLVYPPGLELIVALVACARIGVIPVPVYPPSPMRFAAGLAKLTFVAHDSQATAALTTRGLWRSYQVQLAKRQAAAPWASARAEPALSWSTTDDVRGVASDDFANDPGPVLLLQYTSGSTSDPKGVVVGHDNVLANCAGTLDFVPVCVSWLPPYHDMGLIGYYLYPLISGGTTYGVSPLDFLKRPAVWFETIARVSATHTGAPNFGYEYCLREDKLADDELAGIDLSSLRVMMNAAEPVRPDTCARFLARFTRNGLRPSTLIAAYGLAENTITVAQHGRTAVTVDTRALQRRVLEIAPERTGMSDGLSLMSCGKPVEGVEVAVVDEETRLAVGAGRIGEIWIAGESVCRGYWNRPEQTAGAFHADLSGDSGDASRYLRTGDLGFFHEGELYVCGRIKDLIIVRGVNYYPQDIEAIVESSVPRLRKGCTAAFDAGDRGEGLIVLIGVKNAAGLPDAAAIARTIRAQYFVEPHTIAFVPHRAIPKTTSGKLSRVRAKDLWIRGELPLIASFVCGGDRAPSLASSGLKGRFQHVLALHALTGEEDATFAELGIDSLTMVELIAGVKRLFEEHGAGSLVDAVDARLLQRLTVAEFFGMLDQLERAADRPVASLRALLSRIAEEQNAYERDCMRGDAELADVHVPPPLPAPRVQDVLLTGATGFFGPFLLEALLRETPHTYHALVRAADVREGMDRIRAALRRAQVLTAAVDEGLETRVRVVCGDLARHELGLRHEQWTALAARTHAVVHNGAQVNYVLGYDALRPHNVDGTRELIRFAATGVPKAFHFISSTFINGWTVKEHFRETDGNAAMANLDFGYAQSKWVAERLVSAAGRRGLPVSIYRPSLISASSQGVGSRDDIGVRLLAFMITHGVAPEADNQVSFLPADVAAHNIAVICARASASGSTYHVTVDDVYSMVDVTREITRAYGYPFVYLPVPEFVAEMNRRATKQDPVFPLLDFFNRSHAKISAMARKRYDNDGYRRARDESGAGRPDPGLGATVAYLMEFMLREAMIAAYRTANTTANAAGPLRPYAGSVPGTGS